MSHKLSTILSTLWNKYYHIAFVLEKAKSQIQLAVNSITSVDKDNPNYIKISYTNDKIPPFYIPTPFLPSDFNP